MIFDGGRGRDAALKKTDIEQARFFLTTISRAPEVNLFNLPRVVCWPIHSDPDRRTAFDKLIAFCGTLNGQPYYFQRQNKDSATEDYQSINRNRELYSYLQSLTSLPTPGFGGSIEGRLGQDRDQVLTEMFDYIRSSNLNDLNFTDPARQYAPGQAAVWSDRGKSCRSGSAPPGDLADM